MGYLLLGGAAPGFRGTGNAMLSLAVSGPTVDSTTREMNQADDCLCSSRTGRGAERLLVSADESAMKAARNSFDLIIDTVPVRHDVSVYMPLLDVDQINEAYDHMERSDVRYRFVIDMATLQDAV